MNSNKRKAEEEERKKVTKNARIKEEIPLVVEDEIEKKIIMDETNPRERRKQIKDEIMSDKVVSDKAVSDEFVKDEYDKYKEDTDKDKKTNVQQITVKKNFMQTEVDERDTKGLIKEKGNTKSIDENKSIKTEIVMNNFNIAVKNEDIGKVKIDKKKGKTDNTLFEEDDKQEKEIKVKEKFMEHKVKSDEQKVEDKAKVNSEKKEETKDTKPFDEDDKEEEKDDTNPFEENEHLEFSAYILAYFENI